MKRTTIFAFSILLVMITLAGCNQHKRSDKTEENTANVVGLAAKPGEISQITSLLDPGIRYSVYLPQNFDSSKIYPMIMFFDPHARGSLPLKMYRSLADKFGFIIAGSDITQNGMDMTNSLEVAINTMNDIFRRFPVDSLKTYSSGFSGGSRVAGFCATRISFIKGVIACGAGISYDPTRDTKKINYLGMVGFSDFNYLELKQIEQMLTKTVVNHQLIEFEGKHEWPSVETMENAFFWMYFNLVRDKLLSPDSKMVDDFKSKNREIFSNYREGKNLLAAFRTLYNANVFLKGIAEDKDLEQRSMKLFSDPMVKSQMEEENRLLMIESNTQQGLYVSFEQKPLDWWQKTINELNSKINRLQKGMEADMTRRLLGFVSLYSNLASSGAMKKGDLELTKKFLSIYQMADPSNPDKDYLYAIFFSQTGNTDLSLKNLSNAAKNGFSDPDRVSVDPAFATLRYDTGYVRILGDIKKNKEKQDQAFN